MKNHWIKQFVNLNNVKSPSQRYKQLQDAYLKKHLSGKTWVVKCDAELNTPDVVDKNEMRATITIKF